MSDPIFSGSDQAISLFQWLINGLLGLLMATLGYIWRMLDKRVDETDRRSTQSATDIKVLESVVGGYSDRFDRLEDKIDVLLERRTHPRES